MRSDAHVHVGRCLARAGGRAALDPRPPSARPPTTSSPTPRTSATAHGHGRRATLHPRLRPRTARRPPPLCGGGRRALCVRGRRRHFFSLVYPPNGAYSILLARYAHGRAHCGPGHWPHSDSRPRSRGLVVWMRAQRGAHTPHSTVAQRARSALRLSLLRSRHQWCPAPRRRAAAAAASTAAASSHRR